MTKEEARDEFLKHVARIVAYWLAESRATTTREKVNGAVFSLLVAIDGDSADVPGFKLIPNLPYDDDPEENPDGWPDADISGSLHEHWHKFQPKA